HVAEPHRSVRRGALWQTVPTPTAPAGPPLPAGHRAASPDVGDLDDLVRLLRRHEREARGWPGADSDAVAAEVTGRGASTHLHETVRDADGVLRAWINCHDRAAGRVLVGVIVDPDLPD